VAAVLDTHAAVWYLLKSPSLSPKALNRMSPNFRESQQLAERISRFRLSRISIVSGTSHQNLRGWRIRPKRLSRCENEEGLSGFATPGNNRVR
jgi:hypothetical protein